MASSGDNRLIVPSSCIKLTSNNGGVAPDLRIQLPARCLISGQSGSGKTFLLVDILLDNTKINGTFKKIFWFYNGSIYSEQQTELFDKLSSTATVPIEFSNRPLQETFGNGDHLDIFKDCILVFDDLWDVITENSTVKSMALQFSRHLEFSMFFISQVRL